LLSEVSGVHQDSISQSGSCLGSVSVHSLTLPHTFLHSRECDVTPGLSLALTPGFVLALALGLPLALAPGLPLGPQPYNPFVFGPGPKARVATFQVSHFWEWELHSCTLPKVGLRHSPSLEERSMSSLTLRIFLRNCNCFLFGSLAICRLLRLGPCLKLT